MKDRFSGAIKVIISVIMCGIMLFTSPAINANAKISSKKAFNLMTDLLWEKYTRWAFIDLDNDNMYEMITLEFSGEFVDGADAEKTLSVYKIKGKKPKKIFSCSIEGDYFRPTLDFRLFCNNDTYYMCVDYMHEGYGYTKTYKYTGKKFKQVAFVDMNLAEGEDIYHVGKKTVSKKKYDKYMKDILASPVEPTMEGDCITDETFQEYLKKLLMAEYDYRCEKDLFEEKPTGTSYIDVDGDWYTELRVDTGKNSGYILYYYMGGEYYDQNNYYVGISHFTLDKDGEYVFDELDEENYLTRRAFGDPYVGRWVETGNDKLFIDVVRKGDNYFFTVQYQKNASESEELVFCTERTYHEGYDNWTYFECSWAGIFTVYTKDTKNGKEKKDVKATNIDGVFILEDGKDLYWSCNYEDTHSEWFEDTDYYVFVKAE